MRYHCIYRTCEDVSFRDKLLQPMFKLDGVWFEAVQTGVSKTTYGIQRWFALQSHWDNRLFPIWVEHSEPGPCRDVVLHQDEFSKSEAYASVKARVLLHNRKESLELVVLFVQFYELDDLGDDEEGLPSDYWLPAGRGISLIGPPELPNLIVRW